MRQKDLETAFFEAATAWVKDAKAGRAFGRGVYAEDGDAVLFGCGYWLIRCPKKCFPFTREFVCEYLNIAPTNFCFDKLTADTETTLFDTGCTRPHPTQNKTTLRVFHGADGRDTFLNDAFCKRLSAFGFTGWSQGKEFSPVVFKFYDEPFAVILPVKMQ